MEEFGSLADILVLAPCRAGKKDEWMSAGLENPRRGATSRVILRMNVIYRFMIQTDTNLKYGSWLIAHGMRQGTSFFSSKMNGNVEENDGAAWIAGNPIFPIEQLSSKPKIPTLFYYRFT